MQLRGVLIDYFESTLKVTVKAKNAHNVFEFCTPLPR